MVYQQKRTFVKQKFFFVYPSRRFGISSLCKAQCISSKATEVAFVYHHGVAVYKLRLDDIQHSVLVICNSFRIDDIQGSRLDLFFKFANINTTQKTADISVCGFYYCLRTLVLLYSVCGEVHVTCGCPVYQGILSTEA